MEQLYKQLNCIIKGLEQVSTKIKQFNDSKTNTMKVFGISPYSVYGGGLVIIAANNITEAWDILEKESGNYKISSFDFDKESIFEISHLSTDVTEPQIIIQNYYIE